MGILNLHNILWVVPGFLFIYFFNKYRPQESINLSGWPYVFFIVFIAFVTWLPAELLIEWMINTDVLSKCIFSDFIKNEITKKIIITIIAIILTLFLLLIINWNPIIANKTFFLINDNFCKKCIEWENEIVLLTLKNGKAYIGILWKYPENPKSRHESQSISIIPIKSGYRKQNTQQVIWNTDYPEYTEESDFEDMETIIPRAEIITFGKFHLPTFEHFQSLESELKNNEHISATSSNSDQDK